MTIWNDLTLLHAGGRDAAARTATIITKIATRGNIREGRSRIRSRSGEFTRKIGQRTPDLCYDAAIGYMELNRINLIIFGAILAVSASGCFYPPTAQAPPEDKTSAIVPLPYDLAWTAVNEVIHSNSYNVQAKDPNHGIIEVLGRPFSLQDADCGEIKSVVGTYAAVPEPDSTSVYNFHVKAVSNESSRVAINATFDSPVSVPLRPVRDEQCVSRGAQESRLLQQVLAQARITHPPVYKSAPGAAASHNEQPFGPSRPTLLGPDVLKKPGS